MKDPKAEELLEKVRSNDAGIKLSAIRKIKNQVIGNKRRKKTYIKLNTIERIADLLAENEGDNVRVQTALLLSSLSRVDSSASAFASPDIFQQLVRLLDSRDETIVEAGLRALCNICEEHGPPILSWEELKSMTRLFNCPNKQVVAMAGRLISCLLPGLKTRIGPDEYCGLLSAAGGSIWSGYDTIANEAHISAYTSMYLALPETTILRLQESSFGMPDDVPSFTFKSPGDKLRFCAIWLSLLEANPPSWNFSKHEDLREAIFAAITELVLQNASSVRHNVPVLLRRFLIHNKRWGSYKVMAADSGLVTVFAKNLIKELQQPSLDRKRTLYIINLIQAINCLTSDLEPARRQLHVAFSENGEDISFDKVLNMLGPLSAKQEPQSLLLPVCIGFFRNLSRSAYLLHALQCKFRATIEICLLLMTDQESPPLQALACGHMANLVLDASLVREECVEKGCIAAFLQLIDSDSTELKAMGAQGLANLSLLASRHVRQKIVAAVPGAQKLKEMCTGSMKMESSHAVFHEVPEEPVGMVNASLILREAVFSILQNMLACLEENEKEEETQAQSILDWMSLTWVKQEIVPLESGSMSMNGQRIRSRALGLLNNICAFGGPHCKGQLFDHELLHALVLDIHSNNATITLAALELIEKFSAGNTPTEQLHRGQFNAMGFLDLVTRLESHSECQAMTTQEQIIKTLVALRA